MRAAPSLALLALVLASAGCGGGEEAPEGPANVVLIVVDTLRRDHLGVYGYERDTTPRLDAFAREAAIFERAYTPSPWTRPAVASMLTGLYPSGHRTMALNNVLSAEHETLAEMFAAEGFATAGIVSHVILARQFGLAQGFESWDEEEAGGHDHVSTPGVTERAIAAVDRLATDGRPFLLFVHYFDPHWAYLPHDEVDFAPDGAGALTGGEDIETLRARLDTLSEEEVRFLRDLYDEEIRTTDAGIGRLLARLEALGIEDETVVAIAADHGEEFLERGWLGHTRTLYEELVAVPLLVRGRPGSPGHGQRIPRPVSLVSLTPTLLELAGAAPGERVFEAPSLAALVAGGAAPPAGNVFAEVDFRGPVEKQARKQAVIGARFKMIRDDRRGQVEFYDLSKDPGERNNLARARKAPLADALQRDLYRFSTREPARPEVAEPGQVQLAPDLREQLRRLGYVEGEPAE